MKKIIFTLTFLAFGLASYANSIVIIDQECKNNTKKSASSEPKQQFDDFFEFVELSIVVEDYEYRNQQCYSLNPTLKLRPIKGKTLPEKYKKQLTLEVEYGILGQESGCNCSSYNSVNVVTLYYMNPRYQNEPSCPFIKEKFYFNPTTMVDEDGTISIKSSETNCFVKNLNDIKNAKGVLLKSVWLNPDVSGESLWYNYKWLREPCNGNFIINATGYIQSTIDAKAVAQRNKGLKSYKGRFTMRAPWGGSYTGDVEYYYRDAPNGERIYEDTFYFMCYEQSKYFYASGRFKNDKQVGTWHFSDYDSRAIITFDENGVPDGPFELKFGSSQGYTGRFTNGYMKELKYSTVWGYFNENGKPNGEWIISSVKSPVSRITFNNGVCTKPYYFEYSTGDKKSIPDWVIELPRKERYYLYGKLIGCLFRSTPKHYFQVQY